ncbi:MAG: metallophosphoesterase [bacterium]|nr:metallophosphoesterase [bacterium]
MKILCISDIVVQQMENAAHLRRRYHDVELIVSCGDMPATYLEFITSVLNVPLFYVRGNHDSAYTERPPGGENLHRQLIEYKGLSFFGIEGSIRYNNSPVQYSEGEMRNFVVSAMLPLYLRRMTHKHALDVFVTHAPAFGIHDAEDPPHTGIKAFLRFLDLYRPRYMVHGHVHTYDRRAQTETDYNETLIRNINPVTLLEVEPE